MSTAIAATLAVAWACSIGWLAATGHGSHAVAVLLGGVFGWTLAYTRWR